MARSFRYYGKKRGHRRTGSSRLGSLGEAVFWAVLVLLGCGGVVLMVLNFVVPEWRVNHEFIATTCKVLDKRITERHTKEATLYRPDLYVEYEVGGVVYRDWHYDLHHYDLDGGYSNGREHSQAILDRFAVYDAVQNNRYPCWYDPANLHVAVLERGYRWWIWLAFTVPISFVAIGAGGLIYTLLHWGKSAEHRAARMRRMRQRNRFGAAEQQPFPGVPSGADMANSPGTKLRFRLPMARSPAWTLFALLALCIAWNGVVFVYVAGAIEGIVAGKPDWTLTLFAIPLAIIGIGTIVVFLRQVLRSAGVGPTIIEISDHPLECGGQYRLFVSQVGRLTINDLCVSLVCEETATYRQGTNTRTETQEVHRHELFHGQKLDVQSGQPFATEMDLTLSPRAMHSFKSDHNEVAWRLVIDADVTGWRPSFRRSFPLVIRPANGEDVG